MRRISFWLATMTAAALATFVFRGSIVSASDARDRAAVAQAQIDRAENNFRHANIALGYARGALGAAQADQSAAECRLREALERYAGIERASCDLSNAINAAVDDANRAAARELSAQAALTSTDNRLADAQRRLDEVHAKASKAFQVTEEFQAADASFRAARDAMEVAAAPVMKVLQNDPKYIELLARLNDADRRLRDLINASAAPQQIDAAQKSRDEADRALREFVDERILADPVASVARRALDDAARHCEDLLGKFEEQFAKDPANKGMIELVSIASASRDAAETERAQAANDRVAAGDRLDDLQSQHGQVASDLSSAQRDVDCGRADLSRAEQCVFEAQSNFAAAANALACARSERDGAIAQLRFLIEHDGRDHHDHDRDHHDAGGSSAIVCDDLSPSLGAWTRVRFSARSDHAQSTDDRDRERANREAEFRERREKAEQQAARDRADEAARAATTPTKARVPVIDQAARELAERRASEERAQSLRTEREQRQKTEAKRTANAEEQQKRRAAAERETASQQQATDSAAQARAKRDAAQKQADERASRNREDQRKQAEQNAARDRDAKDRAAREQQAKQQREDKDRQARDRDAQQQRDAKERDEQQRQTKEREAKERAAQQKREAQQEQQQREAKAREDHQRQAAERERQRNDSKRDDKRDSGGGGGNGKKGR